MLLQLPQMAFDKKEIFSRIFEDREFDKASK